MCKLRKEKLLNRKSSVRPPCHLEYKGAALDKEFNCKNYVHRRMQTDVNKI